MIRGHVTRQVPFGEDLFQLDQRTPRKAPCAVSGMVPFSKSRASGSSEFSHHNPAMPLPETAARKTVPGMNEGLGTRKLK